MKITLVELRQVVRSVLSESVCPACGSPGAYVGLHDVECGNHECKFFSLRQMPVGPEISDKLSAEELGQKMIEAVENEGWDVTQDGALDGGYFVEVMPPPYNTPKYMDPFNQRMDEIASELSREGWTVTVDRFKHRWRLVARIALIEFRNLVSPVLKEEDEMLPANVCPECGQKDAVMSQKGVECINKFCSNYSKDRLVKKLMSVYGPWGAGDPTNGN